MADRLTCVVKLSPTHALFSVCRSLVLLAFCVVAACSNGTGTNAVCGDSFVDSASGEQCDPPSTSAACDYGERGCFVCVACKWVSGVTHVCGDNVVDADFGEECDEGRWPDLDCDYGEGCHGHCSASCRRVTGMPHYCGDGCVDPDTDEQCDEPGAPTACNYGQRECLVCQWDCTYVAGTVTFCGDGETQPGDGEECDDANSIDGDGCDSNCTVTACRNDVATAGEECGEPILATCTGPSGACLDCACRLNECVAAGAPRVLNEQVIGIEGALVTANGLLAPGDADVLRLLDARDPQRMQLAATVRVGSLGANIEVEPLVGTDEGWIYGRGNGLLVVNVADPKAPVLIPQPFNGAPYYAMAIAGRNLYCATHYSSVYPQLAPGGLTIFSLADPGHPQLLGSLHMPEDSATIGVFGTTAYLGTTEAFYVIDVSDPTSPVEIGRLDGSVYQCPMVVEMPYLYLACNWVVTIDVSDSTDPRLVATYRPEGITGRVTGMVSPRRGYGVVFGGGQPGLAEGVTFHNDGTITPEWRVDLGSGPTYGAAWRGLVFLGQRIGPGRLLHTWQVCDLP